MLINPAGRVFVGRRNDIRQAAWQMPQGGIDQGETPVQAAMRELTEETGTAKAQVIGETSRWYDYDLPPQAVGKFWGGKYRGQTQKWFALRFTGEDSDIDPRAVAHPEFDDWQWVEPDRLVQLVVPFKRRVYRQVVAELGPLAIPLAIPREATRGGRQETK